MTVIPINVRCVLGEAQTTVNHPGMICRPLPPGRLDGNEKGRQGGKKTHKTREGWGGIKRAVGKISHSAKHLYMRQAYLQHIQKIQMTGFQ